MKQFLYQKTTLPYLLSGSDPRILITSGFHGDEAEVIDLLTEIVRLYQNKLPPFLYIPIACPSAVSKGTRQNKNNADINRSYFPTSSDEEVQAMIELLKPYQFESAYSFHEDPTQKAFYLYNEGLRLPNKTIETLQNRLTENNIALLNGIDDPIDPTLGLLFTNGYRHIAMDTNGFIKNGFFPEYLFAEKKTQQGFTIEIPGQLQKQQKKLIVELFFQTLFVSSS